MLLKFVDRQKELRLLNEKYQSPHPEFIIIYGRRRIGKTELIKQFSTNKKHFYFLARKEPIKLEIDRFRKKISEQFNIYLQETTDFEILFKDIMEKTSKKEKLIIIIDEFPYLIDSYKPIPSIFQGIWDEHLQHEPVMLILTGSSVSMMETEILGYHSPLYGRRTAQFKIEELKINHLSSFLPKYNQENLYKTYGATGGIPYYLKEFNDNNTFLENIQNTFLNPSNILYQEAEILLKEELREPNTYFNILKAMIDGATKLSEISTKSLVDITNINKYISVLETLKLVRKEYPITEPMKQRNFLYIVNDHYFRFWLSYVYPYKEEIEEQPDRVLQLIQQDNPRYMGSIFEEIVKQYIRQHSFIDFNKSGRWWHKTEEIDLICLHQQQKEIFFFENKWKDLSYTQASKIIKDLKEKSTLVNWQSKQRKEHFGLFAKNISQKQKLRDQGFLIFDINDMKH